MKAQPYVGITGPVSANEAYSVLSAFHEVGYDMNTKHIPMIGILASYKTLNGLPVENRRYPAVKSIADILKQADRKALTMIHYNSREPWLSEQVWDVFNKGDLYNSGLCRAVQLNIVWPDVKETNKIKDLFPRMKVVIQLSHKAMENMTDKDIAMRLKEYDADYVLIDPSGGQGKEFDIEKSIGLYNEINLAYHKLTVGFAGGFTGDNVCRKVKSIVDTIKTDDFCIDAEGGLRDKLSDKYGDDLLNMNKVKKYLDAAASILE